MAGDDNDQHIENKDENPGGETKDNTTPDKGEDKSWQELAGVDPEEFKTPEDLAKSYKEARKGLSDQGQKIKEASQFQERTTPILKAIYGNPELYKQVLNAVKKTYGEGDEPDKKETDKIKEVRDPRVDEISDMEEARVIREFEGKAKINEMKPEDQDKVKKEIGEIMKPWINGKPTLAQLSVFLDNAWEIYRSRNNITQEEEKVDTSLGFGTPRAAQATIDKMDVGTLSDEERTAASKMGLSPEEYLESKKAIMKN